MDAITSFTARKKHKVQQVFYFCGIKQNHHNSMQIIPAIDLIGGKCVRLEQGDYAKKTTYFDDPLEVALQFEDNGIQRLHLVDLDGAKAKKIVNWHVLERIATKTNLHIDFGGGVQSDKDIEIAFNSGAKQITGGSIAIKNRELFLHWVANFGSERIILGADVREEYIAIHGWEEKTDVLIYDFLRKYHEIGLQYVICTDVSKDGLLKGPSFELYKNIQTQIPTIQLIASGGVSKMQDVIELQEAGHYGVIIGKAIYEGRISMKMLKDFMLKYG
jgi:phosphoribosylformimino-5-aminoimidazole carboxamide ribotide isomerase